MAQFANPEGTVISHNGLFIPVDPSNRDYRQLIEDGVKIEPYAAPTQNIATMSFAQLMIGLVKEGWITRAEGESWLKGVLPQTVVDIINTYIPVDQQFAAVALATVPSDVEISNTVLRLIAAKQQKSDQLQRFFNTYGAI